MLREGIRTIMLKGTIIKERGRGMRPGRIRVEMLLRRGT